MPCESLGTEPSTQLVLRKVRLSLPYSNNLMGEALWKSGMVTEKSQTNPHLNSRSALKSCSWAKCLSTKGIIAPSEYRCEFKHTREHTLHMNSL